MSRQRERSRADRRARRRAARSRRRHGSYAWSKLRKEVEARLANGEPLKAIVADVRKRYEDCPANLPSDRTFRRWRAEFFAEQRRDPAPRKPERTRRPGPRPAPPVAAISRPPVVHPPAQRPPEVVAGTPRDPQTAAQAAETARPPPE